MKRCAMCCRRKHLRHFVMIKDPRTLRVKPYSYCKDCSRKVAYDQRYGTGAWEWREMKLAEQGGVCARCGTDHPGHRYGWMIDHDHETGLLRDVVCHACNIAIGYIEKRGWDAMAFAKSLENNPL